MNLSSWLNHEFKVLADFKMLAFQNNEFKILAYFRIFGVPKSSIQDFGFPKWGIYDFC